MGDSERPGQGRPTARRRRGRGTAVGDSGGVGPPGVRAGHGRPALLRPHAAAPKGAERTNVDVLRHAPYTPSSNLARRIPKGEYVAMGTQANTHTHPPDTPFPRENTHTCAS